MSFTEALKLVSLKQLLFTDCPLIPDVERREGAPIFRSLVELERSMEDFHIGLGYHGSSFLLLRRSCVGHLSMLG